MQLSFVVTEDQLHEKLKELSLEHGGAWIYSIMPFQRESEPTKFLRFDSPSKVPDTYIGSSKKDVIGYKGKLVPFSKAAQIREQNRGYSKD